ncbi:MAG: hypothetical protein AB1489_39340 [Acidobacteriota bacterium]
MSHRTLNTVKRYVLVTVTIVSLIMMVTSSGAMKDNLATGSTATNEGLSQTSLRAEDVSVKLLSKPTRDGNAILLVRFAKSEERIPSQVLIELEDRELLLRDDGEAGDERAGDGVHSAITTIDPAQDEENFRRIEQLLREKEQPLKAPVFDARVKVGEKELQPILLKEDIAIKIDPVASPLAVDPEKSLVIRDPLVVEDPTRTFNPCTKVGTPMGKWTFGYLMEQMANQAVTGIDPSKFVRLWLRKWEVDQPVNGWTVAKRLQIQNLIIGPWEQASGGPGSPLDLSKAPFKLLAIVNRVDLRDNTVYGGSNAGEARFVFGAIGPNCQILQFTVIFEYGIDRKGCKQVKAWAQQWYDLGALPLGSPAYNAALEAITEQFVKAGAAPSKPNGSALNQLRTNEIALASPWELREFRIVTKPGGTAGLLQQVTVKQTPDISHNKTALLSDYVNINTPAILAGTNVVPDQFPVGNPFLGGSALTPFNHFWNNPAGGPFIINREARFRFSFDTCNACHAGETNTLFTHIKPAPFGVPAGLSGFMTGINVIDPADGMPVRTFNELDRRALDLDNLVNSPCRDQLFFKKILAAH